MFSNIGGKIQTLAKVVCWLGIIGSIVYAVVLWSSSTRYQDFTLIGIAVLVGGCLTSWIMSFFTYGFGELIERVSSIDNKMSGSGNKGYFSGGTGTGNRADMLKQMRNEGIITEEEYRDKLNNR